MTSNFESLAKPILLKEKDPILSATKAPDNVLWIARAVILRETAGKPEVLICRGKQSKNSDIQNKDELPGGKQDPETTLPATARREIIEETHVPVDLSGNAVLFEITTLPYIEGSAYNGLTAQKYAFFGRPLLDVEPETSQEHRGAEYRSLGDVIRHATGNEKGKTYTSDVPIALAALALHNEEFRRYLSPEELVMLGVFQNELAIVER